MFYPPNLKPLHSTFGKVRAVDSDQAPEEVYKQTKDFFKVFA
jgi:hypothetical protein